MAFIKAKRTVQKPTLSPEARDGKLSALSLTISKKREEAVSARKESGIEAVWLAAEEAYLGMDDVNRHEFMGAKWAKPTSMEGPLTTGAQRRGASKRSTAFVRLTSRYVDAGAAKLCEILLPIDDKAFSLEPTPLPDLVKSKDDLSPLLDQMGQQVMRPAKPEEVAATQQGVAPGQSVPNPAQVPMTKADYAMQLLEKAQDSAKGAEKQIFDWMVQCGHAAEMRKIVHDAARIGVGILKGPFPEEQQAQALTRVGENAVALQIKKTIAPATKWVDPWNGFPDPACGEDIQDGDHFFERDYLSPRSLKKLKSMPGYLSAQIDKVIAEGPDKANKDDNRPYTKKNKKRFAVWYYYGALTREDMEAVDTKSVNGLPEDQCDVYAIVTMVNDTVIRATINPLESGKFPYHAVPWSRRAGHWAGVGVSEQAMMPQRLVNAATRALLNNAGKTAGSQIVMDKKGIVPADGIWEITPDKIWYKLGDTIIDDVRKAFMSVEFPSAYDTLMPTIEYGFKLAEEATNIPLISQGQSGPTTPDTFGATQLQNNNANQLLRSIGYAVDDYITEPVVRMFYEWLLLDPEVPDEYKGDFQINAHGSVTLVERSIQDQTIGQMGSIVLNAAFGIDPKKWFAEFMKSKHLNPRNFQYSEEEQQKLESQPPVPDPVIQVAQLNIASSEKIALAEITSAEKIAAGRVASDAQKVGVQSQNELAYAEKEKEISQIAAEGKVRELEMKREILLLEYANKKELTLMQVKAELAKSAADIQVKRDLAAAEVQMKQDEGAHSRTHDLTKHVTSLAAQGNLPEGLPQ